MFDFPNSPTEGQVFAPPGGPRYKFQSQVWDVVAPDAGLVGSAEDAYWPTRAAFVSSVAGGLTIYDGKIYAAGGYEYVGKSGSTVIADLPGLVPKEPACIVHWGAMPDGSADSVTAINAMGAYTKAMGAVASGTHLDYAVIPAGKFRCDTGTLNPRLHFLEGGYFEVALGQTLRITNQIQSPKQWIFRGDGDYNLAHVVVFTFNTPVDYDDPDGQGEEVRQMHASWWGIFPNNEYHLERFDVSPQFNKAMRAVSQIAGVPSGRECILDFDGGNYNFYHTVYLSRATWIRGSGIRRTIFNVSTDGFDVLVTGGWNTNSTDDLGNDIDGQGCRISNIQFERTLVPRLTGCWIRIRHNKCTIDTVNVGGSRKNIIFDGSLPQTSFEYAPTGSLCKDITGGFGGDITGAAWGTDGSLIEVSGGFAYLDIDNVSVPTSSDEGPPQLIRIGGVPGTMGNINIRNVWGVGPSAYVDMDATQCSIFNVLIENLNFGSHSGPIVDGIIRGRTGANFDLTGIIIDGLRTNGRESGSISFHQEGTGETTNIAISNCILKGSTGYGLRFNHVSGPMKWINVADSVLCYSKAIPFDLINFPTVRIAGNAKPTTRSPITYDLGTIAQDGLVTQNIDIGAFTGMILVTGNHNVYALAAVRAASSPNCTTIIANVGTVVVNTDLATGTSGAANTFTISVQNAAIKVNNRFAASYRVSLTLLQAIA